MLKHCTIIDNLTTSCQKGDSSSMKLKLDLSLLYGLAPMESQIMYKNYSSLTRIYLEKNLLLMLIQKTSPMN